MTAFTPGVLGLVRRIDGALRGADHHVDRVRADRDGLGDAWATAGDLVQARTLLFLAQRTGDGLEGSALAQICGFLSLEWPLRPSPVLAVTAGLDDAADDERSLYAAVALAVLVYEPGQAPCGFCAIADDEDPRVQIIDRRPETVAFVPRDPATGKSGGLVPGHWLVIPRVHVPAATSSPEVAAAVFGHMAELAREQGPDSVNLWFSVGPEATASVDHCHGHILPREWGDGLALPHDPYALQGRFNPDAVAAVGDPTADALQGVQRAPRAALVAYVVRAHDVDTADATAFVTWLWPRRMELTPTGRSTWRVLVADALEVWHHHRVRTADPR